MVDDRVRDHPNPESGRVDPPAEVDVLAEQGHAGVEAAHLLPDIPANQHPRAAHRQRVPVAVMLALVHLARLNAGDASADRVDRDTGLHDDVPVSPVHQLRPEHRGGPRLGCPAEELLECIRRWLAVVMQEPEPLRLVPRPATARLA